MEWVCVALFFVCAGLLAVIVYLIGQLEQRTGANNRMEDELSEADKTIRELMAALQPDSRRPSSKKYDDDSWVEPN